MDIPASPQREWQLVKRKQPDGAFRERQAWLSGEALEAALNSEPLNSSLAVLAQTAPHSLGAGTRAACYLTNEDGTALHHVVGWATVFVMFGAAVGLDATWLP